MYFQVACVGIWSKGLSPLKKTGVVNVWHRDLCKTRCVLVVVCPDVPPKIVAYFCFFSLSPDPLFCTSRVQTKPETKSESFIPLIPFLLF